MTVFKFHWTQLSFTDVPSCLHPAELKNSACVPLSPYLTHHRHPLIHQWPLLCPSSSLGRGNLKISLNMAFQDYQLIDADTRKWKRFAILVLDISLQIPFCFNFYKAVVSPFLDKR